MKEKKLLIFKLREGGGRKFYIPENEASKKLFSLIADPRRKAFTQKDLDNIDSLDFEIKILNPRIIYE